VDKSKSLRFPAPTGLSFEVMDLVRIEKWAELNDVIALVRLDYGTAGEEYEELIEFRTRFNSPCQLIMWRSADTVFVHPLVGVRRQYGSVRHALGGLRLKQRIDLTDIIATSWPIDQRFG
jgi:hypothetical protein